MSSSTSFGFMSIADPLSHHTDPPQCKREITDLVRRVHPLPSVRIEDGLKQLREGDDPAAFAVTFTGTPPFSFTYTRSEVIGGKTRVVETQVSGEFLLGPLG
jgi:nucleoporin POM152